MERYEEEAAAEAHAVGILLENAEPEPDELSRLALLDRTATAVRALEQWRDRYLATRARLLERAIPLADALGGKLRAAQLRIQLAWEHRRVARIGEQLELIHRDAAIKLHLEAIDLWRVIDPNATEFRDVIVSCLAMAVPRGMHRELERVADDAKRLRLADGSKRKSMTPLFIGAVYCVVGRWEEGISELKSMMDMNISSPKHRAEMAAIYEAACAHDLEELWRLTAPGAGERRP